MAEWLGSWACHLVVLGSSSPPCYSPNVFSFALSSTPCLKLLPVGIFNHFMFIWNIFSLYIFIDPEKPHWDSGKLTKDINYYYYYYYYYYYLLGLQLHVHVQMYVYNLLFVST